MILYRISLIFRSLIDRDLVLIIRSQDSSNSDSSEIFRTNTVADANFNNTNLYSDILQQVQHDVASGETTFQMSIWDSDPMGTDDFIGYTMPISVEDLTEEWSEEMPLQLNKRKVLSSGKRENIPINHIATGEVWDPDHHTDAERIPSLLNVYFSVLQCHSVLVLLIAFGSTRY